MTKFSKKIISFFEQKSNLAILLSMILCVVVLWPLLDSRLVADDSPIPFYVWSTIEEKGRFGYLLEQAIDVNREHLIAGRMRISGWLAYATPFFLFADNIFLTKIYVIFITLVSVIIFHWFLKKLFGSSSWLSILPLLFFPLIFQIRPYHDPFIVYTGSFQMAVIWLFVSLACFVDFLKTERKSQLIISLLFFFLLANQHEANVIFGILFPILFFWKKGFTSLKKWKYLAILFGYFFIAVISFNSTVILQTALNMERQAFDYDGIDIRVDPVIVGQSILVQAIAPFPFTYALGRSGEEVISYYPHLLSENIPLLICLWLVLIAFFMMLYQDKSLLKEKIINKNLIWTVVFALTIIIFATIPVSLVYKYQTDLLFYGMRGGVANLIVIYQYFGAVLLFGLILFLTKRFWYNKLWISVIIAVFLASGIYVNYIYNLATVRQVSKAYGDHYFLFDRAKSAGFFESIENQEWVLFLNRREQNYYYVNEGHTWVNNLRFYFRNHSEIISFCQRDWNEICLRRFDSEQNNFWLYYDNLGENAGYIVLGRVNDIDGVGNLLSHSLKIFYTSSELNNNWPTPIFPHLARNILVIGQQVDEDGEIVDFADHFEVVRDREHNSFIIEIDSELPLILDSVIPILMQRDRLVR
ncbi:MAG: hypothetical protein LBG64_00805 [Pseudomonadales bacterium]|jgi:hypothetical protein|nr:hypothetical protein [Pseudomonadales bacterium]